jgi:hypothetical protein
VCGYWTSACQSGSGSRNNSNTTINSWMDCPCCTSRYDLPVRLMDSRWMTCNMAACTLLHELWRTGPTAITAIFLLHISQMISCLPAKFSSLVPTSFAEKERTLDFVDTNKATDAPKGYSVACTRSCHICTYPCFVSSPATPASMSRVHRVCTWRTVLPLQWTWLYSYHGRLNI